MIASPVSGRSRAPQARFACAAAAFLAACAIASAADPSGATPDGASATASTSTLATAGDGPSSGFSLQKEFAVGGEGGWDCITVDSDARRIYASHGNRVEVLDADSGATVGAIEKTEGVHGIAIAPEAGRGYVTNGRTNSVTVFDTKSLAVLDTVPTGENPDIVIYDPVTRSVFAFNGRSNDVTVIDTATTAVKATIKLDGKPEFAVADGKGHVFINLEDKNAIADIDAKALKVVHTYPVAPGEEPSGLAMDTESRRLFAVCGNKMMAILDADTGKVLATPPIGSGVDGAVFDPATKTAFASCGSDAVLSAVREDSPTQFTPLQPVPTRQGARTVGIDQKTSQLVLPTAKFGPMPAPAPDAQPGRRQRPPILPGTFEILVVGRDSAKSPKI